MRAKALLSFCVSSDQSGSLRAIYASRVSACGLFSGKDHKWTIAACRIIKRAVSTPTLSAKDGGETPAAPATGMVASPVADVYARFFSTTARSAAGAARAAAAVLPASAAAAAGPAAVSRGAGAARAALLKTATAGPTTAASGEAAALERSSAARAAAAPATKAVRRGGDASARAYGVAGYAARIATATRARLRSEARATRTSAAAPAEEPPTTAAAANLRSTHTAAATEWKLGPASWQRLVSPLAHPPPTCALKARRDGCSPSASGVSQDSSGSPPHGLLLLPRVQHSTRALCAWKPRRVDLFFHYRLFMGDVPFASSPAYRVATATYDSVCGASTCGGSNTCNIPLSTDLSRSSLLRHSALRFVPAAAHAAVCPGTACFTHVPTLVISAGSAAASVASLRLCNLPVRSRLNCVFSRRPGKSDTVTFPAPGGAVATITRVCAARDAADGRDAATAARPEHDAGSVTSACAGGPASSCVPDVRDRTSSVCVSRKSTHRSNLAIAALQSGNRRSSSTTSSSSYSSTAPTGALVLLGFWPLLVFFICVSMLVPGTASVSFFGLDRPFSAAFIFSVLGVYGAWSVAEASDSTAVKKFLTRNFLLSIENLRQKRFHTIFTASLTHASPGHLLANVFIIGQLCRLLSSQLWPSEFFYLFCLSSAMGAAGHFLTSRRPVVGASAFAYALLWTEAIKNSRELFRILPFPFLPVTALQFCQVALLFECCMALLSRRYSTKLPWRLRQLLCSVSWSGHLGGLAAGCTYSWYKRTVEREALRWPSFVQLNRRYALSDWTFTLHDLRDSLKILRLECKLLTSSSELEKTVVLRVLEKLRAQKEFRRVAVAHGALLR